MRPLYLWFVLLLAKMLVLAGREVAWSWWAPIAYLWQDSLVVLLFAVVCAATRRRPSIGWWVYSILVLYTAINVSIAYVLSTPLTWSLLRATRGALADSILYYVTWDNLLRIAVVLSVAVALPLVFRRFSRPLSPRLALVEMSLAFVIVVLGPAATARVDTLGLHRNALIALVTTALPRMEATEFAGEWRVSPFGTTQEEDLSYLRGAARGRNVVLIHLESTGAQYLRPYGAAEDPMPCLSEQSSQALLFENAYTVYPETIKSFFAVQCSIYPAVDTQPEEYEAIPAPGLAALLASNGYRTGVFHSGRFMYLGMESVLKGRGYQTREDAGAIGGERESSFGIDEASTVRRVLRWIDEGPRNQPFFVTYLPIAGHHPYTTPDSGPYSPREEINRYRNALHYSDQSLRLLMDGLQQRGLERETLLIILGDHGEAFGQHEGNCGHTFFLYDENVRVPYLIVAPGLIEKPLRIHRPASLLDTAPTVLDLLGMPRPESYQGRSLLAGQTAVALFCTDYSLLLLGLRDHRWKMIHEPESGRTRLFDVSNDPEEKKDVTGENAERVAAYVEHLKRWAGAQKHLVRRAAVK